jgi:hypothetical protein
MSIVGLDAPDFRTISEFRKRHLKALSELFKPVLLLCETAGLVKLGHVALDGTKIKANASKHKAMSYGRMEERATELEAEVASWLSAAEAADAEEDKLHGRDKSGEEMPDWVADKQRRAEKIRQAKAKLEAEAKAAAEAELKEQAEAAAKREAEGRRKGGRPVAPPSTAPALVDQSLRTYRKIGDWAAARWHAAAPAHRGKARRRHQSPDQHGARAAFRLAYKIDAPVEAVGEIDIDMARRAEHHGCRLSV